MGHVDPVVAQAYRKAYYRATRAARIKAAEDWRTANPERSKENQKKWREENRAYVNTYDRRRRARDFAANPKLAWAQHAIKRTRERARKKGVPFNLTVADLYLPDVCPVFGTLFDYNTHGKTYDFAIGPSVDRVLGELGYVKGNVRIISYRANSIKQDATCDEIRAFLSYMEGGARGKCA